MANSRAKHEKLPGARRARAQAAAAALGVRRPCPRGQLRRWRRPLGPKVLRLPLLRLRLSSSLPWGCSRVVGLGLGRSARLSVGPHLSLGFLFDIIGLGLFDCTPFFFAPGNVTVLVLLHHHKLHRLVHLSWE